MVREASKGGDASDVKYTIHVHSPRHHRQRARFHLLHRVGAERVHGAFGATGISTAW